MNDAGRVITAKLSRDLAARMDEIADRLDRSKSWIVRQALAEWVSDEQRSYALSQKALNNDDDGRTISTQRKPR